MDYVHKQKYIASLCQNAVQNHDKINDFIIIIILIGCVFLGVILLTQQKLTEKNHETASLKDGQG